MLNPAFAIFAVIIFAFALHVIFDIKSQLTPLISLAVLVDILVVLCMVDMLKPALYLSYALAVGAFLVALYRCRDNIGDKLRSFLSPGVIMFIVASVGMFVLLAVRQPLMQEWDEFSFWGISKKLVQIHDRIYTYYKSSMIGNSTPPTLAVISYFFHGAGAEFADWIAFLSYDVMFFACYSALTGAFAEKSWNSAFVAYLFGFLSPYIFEVYTKIIHIEPVYINTLADMPLGIVFSGALAVYFFADKKDSRDVLGLLPVLILLTMIKDMGFALSCIVAFIAFFDMVAGRKEFSYLKLKGFFGKVSAGFSMVMVAAVSFFSWSFHMAKIMERDPFALGGATNMGMVEMLIVGVKELLIGPQSEKFVIIKGQMADAFFHTRLSMLGSGVVIFALVTALFGLSAVLGDKNGRKRSVMMYLTSVVGFVGYYVFHLFLYVYIFKDNAYGLVSYNRYIYPYYIGWLSMGIMCLSLAVRDGRRFLSKTVLFGFTAVVFLIFNIYTSYDLLFIEASDRAFATRYSIRGKVNYIQDAIEPDDVLYIYSGGDVGDRWFIYTHELAANYVMEDYGVDVEGLSAEEAKAKYQQTMYERFKAAGVTNVLIDNSSGFFVDNFGDLFDVPMNDIGMDSVAYYAVDYSDEWFSFRFIKGGIVPNE